MSSDLQSNRDTIVQEIQTAFADVTRDEGVSWSETEVIDMSGSEEARRAARAQDTDRNWTELIDDPQWNAPGIGGFSFLDPAGFRYYLPAAMIRSIRDDWQGDLTFHLTLPSNPANPHHNLRMGNHRIERWSSLNERQCKCIARFLRYMIARDEQRHPANSEWREPYDSYWHRFA